MRIGIITFHCAYNFGSALQAFALRKYLSSCGHDAVVIDYRSRDFEQYRLFHWGSPLTMAKDLYLLGRNIRRREAFETFLRDEVGITPRSYDWSDEEHLVELQDDFDCFVCGSDQIWNLDCTRGPVAPFFLSFAGNRKRVAYAPSLAHESFRPEYFGAKERREISTWLSAFDAISVREASTAKTFSSLTDQPIAQCIDPTLLLDGDDYKPLMRAIGLNAPYLFVYMLERCDELVAKADGLALRHGLEIIYISKRPIVFKSKSRNYFGCGPGEFLWLLAHARAVVTNSFHATVFSLLLEVPFLTFPTRRSGSRMRELLLSLGVEDHLAGEGAHEDPLPVGRETYASHLESLRAASKKFLHESLKD